MSYSARKRYQKNPSIQQFPAKQNIFMISSSYDGERENFDFLPSKSAVGNTDCFLFFLTILGVKIGYHSRFNPECNTERSFIDSLSIALGLPSPHKQTTFAFLCLKHKLQSLISCILWQKIPCRIIKYLYIGPQVKVFSYGQKKLYWEYKNIISCYQV